jgi:hypothetical protein
MTTFQDGGPDPTAMMSGDAPIPTGPLRRHPASSRS